MLSVARFLVESFPSLASFKVSLVLPFSLFRQLSLASNVLLSSLSLSFFISSLIYTLVALHSSSVYVAHITLLSRLSPGLSFLHTSLCQVHLHNEPWDAFSKLQVVIRVVLENQHIVVPTDFVDGFAVSAR